MGTAQYNDSSVKERPAVTTPHGGHDAKTPATSGDSTPSWQVFLEGAAMWILALFELEQLECRSMTSLHDADSLVVGPDWTSHPSSSPARR